MLIKLEQSLQDLKTLEADVAELGDSIGADALEGQRGRILGRPGGEPERAQAA